jgi:hypothetical protein
MAGFQVESWQAREVKLFFLSFFIVPQEAEHHQQLGLKHFKVFFYYTEDYSIIQNRQGAGLMNRERNGRPGSGRRLAALKSPSAPPPAPPGTIAAIAAVSATAIFANDEIWLEVWLEVSTAAAAVTSPLGSCVAVVVSAVVSRCGLVVTTPARVGPRTCALLGSAPAAGSFAGVRITVFALSTSRGCQLPCRRHGLEEIERHFRRSVAGRVNRVGDPGDPSRRLRRNCYSHLQITFFS